MKLCSSVAVIFWLLCASTCALGGSFKTSDYFSREEIQRAARFNGYLYVLFFCKQLTAISFLGLVAWSRLASSYQRDVERLCLGKKGLLLPVYAFFILLMIHFVILPFDAARDLVVKARFGLTTQRVGGWVADRLKTFIAVDVWQVPLVILVYATMRRLKRTWWLFSAGAVGVVLVGWYSLAPHLVEPLFYRIRPIGSEMLHGHLARLMEKSGLPRGAVYQADSGKKTREVNAYLSGLFLGRRIVLYDVLAKGADPSEIEFVVAHEIGHWKNNHVIKGIGWGTAGAAGCLFLIGALLRLSSRKTKQQQTGRYEPSSLPAFFFWLHVVVFLVMPLGCAISRRYEKTADRYAIAVTNDPQGAIRLFQKVARRNIADLDPPPFMKFWLYTHPPIPERIQAALRMARRPATGGADPSPFTPPAERAPAGCSGGRGSPALPEAGFSMAVVADDEVIIPGTRVNFDL